MPSLYHWFSFVCGQNNCWYLAGHLLPMCQRCTGLYVGSAWALVCWFVLRPRPTPCVLWVHALFLLAMIPFGYHVVPQNGDIRTSTGWLFAFGLVYFMATFAPPVRNLSPTGNPVFPTGVTLWNSVAEWRDLHSRLRTVVYVACVTAGIPALLTAVHLGAARTALVCSLLAVVGFLTLALLVAIVLLTLARDAIRRLCQV